LELIFMTFRGRRRMRLREALFSRNSEKPCRGHSESRCEAPCRDRNPSIFALIFVSRSRAPFFIDFMLIYVDSGTPFRYVSSPFSHRISDRMFSMAFFARSQIFTRMSKTRTSLSATRLKP
jgi:hypothetical protein